MPRNLFLDFDGVLVDSNSIKAQAFYDLGFKHFGKARADEFLSYHQQNPGQNRFTNISWLLDKSPKNFKTPTQQDLEEEYSRLVLTKIQEVQRVESLADLLDNSSYVPHVLSAAPTIELIELTKNFGWAETFESRIHGSPDSKTHHLKKLAETVDLADSVFVGDAVSDFEVAVNFNMPFVFVSNWSAWHPTRSERNLFMGIWPSLEIFLRVRRRG